MVSGEEAFAAMFAFMFLLFGVSFHVIAIAGSRLQFLVAELTLCGNEKHGLIFWYIKNVHKQKNDWHLNGNYLKCLSADVKKGKLQKKINKNSIIMLFNVKERKIT